MKPLIEPAAEIAVKDGNPSRLSDWMGSVENDDAVGGVNGLDGTDGIGNGGGRGQASW
jgi:hypothetical protein